MKLTASDLFAAGARIIGILAIIKGINLLIMTVPTAFGLYGQYYPDWAVAQQIIPLIYPLVLLLTGIYLLTGIGGLVKKFYPNAEELALESARSVFKLAMKITGMVLIVFAVPELLRLLSNALYMGYYQRFGIDVSGQQQIVIEGTLATIVSLLFGFYLLYGGRFFERLAFKDGNNEQDASNSSQER